MRKEYNFISKSTGKEVPFTIVKVNKRTYILEVTCHRTGKRKLIKRKELS